jgi:4-hydroxybenzoate polyprenyltransferase
VDALRDTAAARTYKPVVSGTVGTRTVRAAAVAALVLCVPLSLASGLLAGAAHLVGVASGWAYNLGLKATRWSWLPYAAGFGSLPAFISLGLPGRPWPAWWAVAAAALLGVGAHLANVLPDIATDLRAGVHGWPQRLGPVRARMLLPFPLVAATVLLAVGPGRPGPVEVALSALAVATVAGGSLLGRMRPRVPFLAAMVVAAAGVGLLVWRGSSLG